jgi:hypothetical protein
MSNLNVNVTEFMTIIEGLKALEGNLRASARENQAAGGIDSNELENEIHRVQLVTMKIRDQYKGLYYDYDLQTYIENGVIAPCAHPTKQPGCISCQYVNMDVSEVKMIISKKQKFHLQKNEVFPF